MIYEHGLHLRRRGLAATTIEIRLSKLYRFDDEVGLCVADAAAIDRFLDGRRGRGGGPLSAPARYAWVSHLHQFYRWAIDWGHLHGDPTVQVPRPKQRRHLPRPIDTGDLVVALDMATPIMRSWLVLASFAGLRVSEIAGLEIDGILWEPGLLRVLGKGGKERLIPMHPEVQRVLRAQRLPTRGRVFRRPRGGGYPAAQVSKEMALYLESLSIDATAHMCRHWFGTQLYRQSRDLRVVQELMGHSSPTTTAIYADWSRHEAERAVAALSLDDTEPTLFSEWPNR
jgi:integrase/recombinase XerC